MICFWIHVIRVIKFSAQGKMCQAHIWSPWADWPGNQLVRPITSPKKKQYHSMALQLIKQEKTNFLQLIIFTGCWSDAQVSATRPPGELDACLQSPRQPCCCWTPPLRGEGAQTWFSLSSLLSLTLSSSQTTYNTQVQLATTIHWSDHFHFATFDFLTGGGVAACSPASRFKQPGDSSCISPLKPVGGLAKQSLSQI